MSTYLHARRLALTGVAEVLLARCEEADRDARLVVIKRLLPHVRSSERFVETYLDRVERARTLEHASAVRIVDVEVSPETVSVVHEYQRGDQVDALIERASTARVPIGIAGRIIADAASAVQAAHEIGLLHLDLRPSNVFVTEDGQVRVADFGVAAAQVDDAFTRPGTRRQRFAYAPPEMLEEEPYDERSDVFTLGVLFWELLAGRRLHTGRSPAEVVKSVRALVVPPPSAIDPAVPPELDAVVLAALERDRARRIPSARQLNEAIEGALRALHLNVDARLVSVWMNAAHDAPHEERRRTELEVMTGEARPLAPMPLPLPPAPSRSSPLPPPLPAPPSWRRPLLLGMLVLFSLISVVAIVKILGATTG